MYQVSLFLFAVYFATNAWSRILVVATYFAICLTPKILYLTVSHQNILANYESVCAICSRHLRLISPVHRNVAGRLCGRPTIVFLIFQIKKHGLGLSFAINTWFNISVAATYLPVRLTPKTLDLTVSHQIIIANNNAKRYEPVMTCTHKPGQNNRVY